MSLAGIWNITLQIGSTDVKSITDTDSNGNATDFTGSVMVARVSSGYDDDAFFEITSTAGEITFPGSGEVRFLFTEANIAKITDPLVNGRWQVDHTPSGGVEERVIEGMVRLSKKVQDAV